MLDKTAQPSVCLVVCGGIAAYKACEVLRGLQKADCRSTTMPKLLLLTLTLLTGQIAW